MTTQCVLSFHGVPIAIAEDRELLSEQMSIYTAEQQLAMTITEEVEVLR